MGAAGYVFFVDDFMNSPKTKLWNYEQGLAYRLVIDFVSVSPVPGYVCGGRPGSVQWYSLPQLAILLSCFQKTPAETLELLIWLANQKALCEDKDGRWYQPEALQKAKDREKKSVAAQKGKGASKGKTQADTQATAPAHAQQMQDTCSADAQQMQGTCSTLNRSLSHVRNGSPENEEPNGSLSGSVPDATPRIDYQGIMDAWNAMCPKKAIQRMTDRRKRHVKARVSECAERGDPTYWTKMLERVREIIREDSRDWRGPQPGFSWFEFDWLVGSEGNFTKVEEGKYDEKDTPDCMMTDVEREIAAMEIPPFVDPGGMF